VIARSDSSRRSRDPIDLPPANILEESQQIAVGIDDHELSVSHLAIAPPIPTVLEIDEDRGACAPDPFNQPRRIADPDLEVGATAERSLEGRCAEATGPAASSSISSASSRLR